MDSAVAPSPTDEAEPRPRPAVCYSRPLRWTLWLTSRVAVAIDKLVRRSLREDRPPILDVDRDYPALRVLDAHVDTIRQELEAVLPLAAGVPRYHEVNTDQRRLSEGERAWRTLFVHLRGAGDRMPNRDLCPRTAALVAGVPGVLKGFFSILEPGKSIAPHRAPTHAYLRYHLALRVPTDVPPTFFVGDRTYTWREGESLLFDDTFEHSVHNVSTQPRVVLLVDVVRPLPWPLGWLNRLAVALLYAKPFTTPVLPTLAVARPNAARR